jgi:hypothetical protein
MQYKALTYINLPLLDIKKAPGDTITDEEFEAGGQTESDIQNLLDGGSISTDTNAQLHPDHQPANAPETEGMNIVASDEGKGVTNA